MNPWAAFFIGVVIGLVGGVFMVAIFTAGGRDDVARGEK